MQCQFCGQTFAPRVGIGQYEPRVAYLSVGDYVRHLITDHWGVLVKVHEVYERGEL